MSKRATILMAAILLVLTARTNASPQRPHLDILAKQWISAFGAGEDVMRPFLTRSIAEEELRKRSIDERMKGYRTLRKRFDTLTLKTVISSSDGTYEVLLVATDGSEHEFIFTGQTQAPFKLLSIGLREMHHQH
jgi:hypothetical protein